MKRTIRAAAILLMSGMLAVGAGTGSRAAEADTISNGISIGGIDVSGMTVEQAQSAVQAKVQEMGGATVTLQMGENTKQKTLNELGFYWKNPDVVEEAAKLGRTGNIVARYKEQKDLEQTNKEFEIEYSTDASTYQAFVNECQEFNSEPVEGMIYPADEGGFYVEGGTSGLTLNETASVAALTSYLESWTGGDGTVQMVYDEVKPQVTQEVLNQVTDVLGQATTTYYSSTAGRAQNIETGTAKINGTLLLPGESFSVTAAVVPFTAENGYAQAASYEENRVVDSYGGGICQVSTTLYNAVLKAELEVTARSNHTMSVGYVDPSKDAAIAEGTMDLSFVNTWDYPVYIEGHAWGGEVTFTIYGHETRPADRSIEFVSEVTGQTEPTGVKLYAKEDQNIGYLQQVQAAHMGTTAVLWKYIYTNEGTEKIQVNSSNYVAVPVCYEVGTASSNSSLVSAIYSAIASNSLEQVQAVIASSTTPQTEATEAPEPEPEQPVEPGPGGETPSPGGEETPGPGGEETPNPGGEEVPGPGGEEIPGGNIITEMPDDVPLTIE